MSDIPAPIENPGAPASDKMLALAEYVRTALGDAVEVAEFHKDEFCILIRAQSIKQVMTFLRDDPDCAFKQLMSVCGADYPSRPLRFDVVHHLLSMTNNTRTRVKLRTDAETPVDSVAGIFSTANWFERETWDLYGIYFNGHPDLRRILTDYGFDGHPLRKDFPLTGYVELRYDEEQRRVVYEPVRLVQDFRAFDFLSPWEGMTDVRLPSDEKAVRPIGWQPVAKEINR